MDRNKNQTSRNHPTEETNVNMIQISCWSKFPIISQRRNP